MIGRVAGWIATAIVAFIVLAWVWTSLSPHGGTWPNPGPQQDSCAWTYSAAQHSLCVSTNDWGSGN